jgi:hypothetical protein
MGSMFYSMQSKQMGFVIALLQTLLGDIVSVFWRTAD